MKKIIAIIGFLGIFGAYTTSSFAGYFNSAPLPRCEQTLTTTLSLGSENSQVYALQALLVSTGYLSATPNGYFGHQTSSAVRAFQRDNDLSRTGVVDGTTRELLNDTLCYGVSSMMSSYGSQDTFLSLGTTYVSNSDPFVTVISPQNQAPAVYATPQGSLNGRVTSFSNVSTVSTNGAPSFSELMAPSQAELTGTSIVYDPAIGYTIGLRQSAGVISVSSPMPNTIYREGDTVSVNWSSSNLTSSTYTVLFENNNTNQSKVLAVLSGGSYSFVLTKELLDALCYGSCGSGVQNTFRVVVSTQIRDIAGNVSTLRAPIAPLTIKRPPTLGTVTLISNTQPVNSGEKFKLYVNTPVDGVGETLLPENYSIRMRATCPPSVVVVLAGVSCGQDFVIPFAPVSFQREIPVSITNTSWYKQEVLFDIVLTDFAGRIVGTASTKVIANPAPFNW